MTAAERQPDGDHPVHSDRIEDGHRVVDILPVPVGPGLRGPVGLPVAPPLDGDYPEVPGQVRDLCLPLPGVHDRPRGEQQDHRLARAENLVADLDAAAFHETFGVWIHRPHDRPLSAEAGRTPCHQFYRRPLQSRCKRARHRRATRRTHQHHTRYIAEWMRGQAAGGYITRDAVHNHYSPGWTEEQAFVLVNPDGGAYAPMSQPGGYALGAQAGEAAIRRLATEAGFTRFRRAAETPSQRGVSWPLGCRAGGKPGVRPARWRASRR